MTSLSEGDRGETGLEQVISLCGEQASVENIYSAVTPSEVWRIKEANPEIMSKLCFKVRKQDRIIIFDHLLTCSAGGEAGGRCGQQL